jgi:hypothetical protein
MSKDEEYLNSRQFNWRENKKPTGLASRCDCVLLEGDCNVIWNVEKNKAKTFFINTRVFKYAFESMLKICRDDPNVGGGIILIIGGEDMSFPNCTDLRFKNRKMSEKLINDVLKFIDSEKVLKCYVENLDTENLSKKIVAIPLGLNPREAPVNLTYYKNFISNEKIYDKPLKFTNFNRERSGLQFINRRHLKILCDSKWSKYYINTGFNNDHKSFLTILSKYPFSLCENGGGGIDSCVNPKLWECLILGVIPIMRRTIMTKMYENLPVILIDNWDDLIMNEETLKSWLEKCKVWTTDGKRKELLSKLTLNYWYKKMLNGEDNFFD